MTTFLLLALALITASAIVALLGAMHGAVDGYEDELQFHRGVAPHPTAAGRSPAAAALETSRKESARLKRRPQLIPTEIAAPELAGISPRQHRHIAR